MWSYRLLVCKPWDSFWVHSISMCLTQCEYILSECGHCGHRVQIVRKHSVNIVWMWCEQTKRVNAVCIECKHGVYTVHIHHEYGVYTVWLYNMNTVLIQYIVMIYGYSMNSVNTTWIWCVCMQCDYTVSILCKHSECEHSIIQCDHSVNAMLTCFCK